MAADGTNRDENLEGLWRNCADSIKHALVHFSAAAQEGEPFHNRKWAILSVAHAAEVYCNLLLSEFEPGHPSAPNGHYPSLSAVRRMLTTHPRLSASERYVIGDVLSPLADQRNTLMHMPAPEMLSVTATAIALLALLHIIRRRTGVRSTEFFDQRPPIEQDIFEEIDWREHSEWFKTSEYLVSAEYGEEHVTGCDNCGAMAVPASLPCQACFQEARRQG